MGPDVFLQHARLFAANTTFLTDVLAPPSASDVDIIFIGLVPERQVEYDEWRLINFGHKQSDFLLTDPPSKILTRVGSVGFEEASLSFHSSFEVFSLTLISFTFFP